MSPPTYICVARHGETDWNIAGILQGWTDVPINDQGRRQAYELVGGFSHAGFAKVYSSPLIRSRETAEIIARSLRLEPPACHDGLMERNFGAIQGIPKSELADLNPVLLQQILKRNPATDFEQGETMDEFADRVLDAVASIARPNAGTRILAITHGWVMDVITRHIAGLPRTAILNMKRRNGECVWLEVRGESIRPL
ncbi:MAG: histidine phosphatase family protein [Pseudomonadota bacterium]